MPLRHHSRLLHLGIGRRYAGQKVVLLVADTDVRVITPDGQLIAHITINPTRRYQPQTQP